MATPRAAHHKGPHKGRPPSRGQVYKVKDSSSPQIYAFEVGCEHEPGEEGYIRLATLFMHTEAYLSVEEAEALGEVLKLAAEELRARASKRRAA